MSRRVKVQYTSGETVLGSKLLSLPATTEEFFELIKQRFAIGPSDHLQMKVDEADVDDIDIIRDDDTVVVSRIGDILQKRPAMPFAPSVTALAFYPPPSFPGAGMFGDSLGGFGPYGDMNSARFALQNRMVPKKRRYRRTHKELARNHKCTIEGCGRLYASENSLVQHIRIKHPSFAGDVAKKGRKPSTGALEVGGVFSDGGVVSGTEIRPYPEGGSESVEVGVGIGMTMAMELHGEHAGEERPKDMVETGLDNNKVDMRMEDRMEAVLENRMETGIENRIDGVKIDYGMKNRMEGGVEAVMENRMDATMDSSMESKRAEVVMGMENVGTAVETSLPVDE